MNALDICNGFGSRFFRVPFLPLFCLTRLHSSLHVFIALCAGSYFLVHIVQILRVSFLVFAGVRFAGAIFGRSCV
ncbi:hypothetical protein D3C86_1331720 [compost metagenome]